MNLQADYLRNAIALFTLVLAAPGAFAASGGPLTPPGPPAVVYKTLNELEPRTPVSSLPYSITAPGSYYITTNLVGVASQNGITISANDVTLDLSGFSLVGVASSLDGIQVSGARTNIAVFNGVVRDWRNDGVDCASAYNSQLRDLRVSNCGANGLVVNQGSVVTSCSAFGNVLNGIMASFGSTVLNCTASSNTNGIVVSDSSTATGCTAASNGTNGIVTASGATVTGCTVRANKTGINVGDDGRIVGNLCTGSIEGILIIGSDNRIEGNHITDNAMGIDCNGAGNLIICNTLAGNTTRYSISSGNSYAAVLVSPGSGFMASNPWSNFSY